MIVGDAVISNPTAWEAAKISISFPSEDGELKEGSIYDAKPEIRHLFREPEARPASIVSNAFTLLCLSPFLLMLGLYGMFWLQLNMFQTVKYLVVLGVVTFLCGNS